MVTEGTHGNSVDISVWTAYYNLVWHDITYSLWTHVCLLVYFMPNGWVDLMVSLCDLLWLR
jgi:hypothetical protein